MHRKFRELLGKATGESKSVIALNLDVRGFSKFSLNVDSTETALYIRKLYEVILERFYPNASFFKPTGDGLLVVFDLTEGDTEGLRATAIDAVGRSLNLIETFPDLLADDEWIYFGVPRQLGIGMARGVACRLSAEDQTLDYSGTVLNVASRLMDIARPEGLVIDESFPFSLLEDDTQETFKRDNNVYIRSVAEDAPRAVFYDADRTTISAANRRPLEKINWNEHREECSLKEFEALGPRFQIELEAEPLDARQIHVQATCPTKQPKGDEDPIFWILGPPAETGAWTYKVEAGTPTVTLNIAEFVKRIKAQGAKGTWPISLIIRYPS